jgi:hypothetical protein
VVDVRDRVLLASRDGIVAVADREASFRQVIVAVDVAADRIFDGFPTAAPAEFRVRLRRAFVGHLGAGLPRAAAGRRRAHDVRDHGRARGVARHLGAPQDLDAKHFLRCDAAEHVAQVLALRAETLAVDEHVADGAREAAALVAGIAVGRDQHEARRLADHVERRARCEGVIERRLVHDAIGRGRRRGSLCGDAAAERDEQE